MKKIFVFVVSSSFLLASVGVHAMQEKHKSLWLNDCYTKEKGEKVITLKFSNHQDFCINKSDAAAVKNVRRAFAFDEKKVDIRVEYFLNETLKQGDTYDFLCPESVRFLDFWPWFKDPRENCFDKHVDFDAEGEERLAIYSDLDLVVIPYLDFFNKDTALYKKVLYFELTRKAQESLLVIFAHSVELAYRSGCNRVRYLEKWKAVVLFLWGNFEYSLEDRSFLLKSLVQSKNKNNERTWGAFLNSLIERLKKGYVNKQK